MRIPHKLKIGGIVYDVRISSKIKSAGEILRSCNIIKINKSLSHECKEEALFHEIVHALCFELTEKETEALSQGIYAILKDNNLLK
jgi:hypothetical protein